MAGLQITTRFRVCVICSLGLTAELRKNNKLDHKQQDEKLHQLLHKNTLHYCCTINRYRYCFVPLSALVYKQLLFTETTIGEQLTKHGIVSAGASRSDRHRHSCTGRVPTSRIPRLPYLTGSNDYPYELDSTSRGSRFPALFCEFLNMFIWSTQNSKEYSLA